MRGVFVGLFMMLVLSSFVVAASSEVVVDFNVGVPTGEVLGDISSESSAGDWLGYIILAVVILAIIYFSFKKKHPKKKHPKKKKRSKSKK